MDPSTSAAALKAEIARLTGAIEQRKIAEANARTSAYSSRPRGNVYINPNYKPPSRSAPTARPVSRPLVPPTAANTAPKEVVIGGVAFQSSGRSLVRKDLAKPPPSMSKPQAPVSRHPFVKPRGSLMRPYKPKASRGRNMTLNNTRRPFQSRRVSRQRKYVDKPCPRFTTTGACNRGLTCPYQHDPAKIAICWNFLQGNCAKTAETCNLSHDPTPERTPLCVHFANNGRCTRANCPYPHVRVGQRHGVCRDFAVLGYCEKGLDCDKQHVRECPDFAENGACTTKGCKLPHVIRANRTRKTISKSNDTPPSSSGASTANPSVAGSDVDSDATASAGARQVHAEDGQMGDEYISLTFLESDSEDESDEDEDDDDEEDDEEEEGEDEDDT